MVDSGVPSTPSFPLVGESIVCLAGEDWWYHPMRSRRQLMTRLARQNRVLFVNSIGMRMPRAAKTDSGGRFSRKVRSWLRGLRLVAPNLHVFSPVSLPGGGTGFAARASDRFLAFQVRVAMRLCGVRSPILWVGLPVFAPLIGRLGERLVVYHASDKFDAYEEADRETIRPLVERCIRSADRVIAVSQSLAEEADRINIDASARIVTHGVDVEHFARARRGDCPIPDCLGSIPRPRLGYVGTLELHQDVDLLEKIARRRPEWHLVFVGPDAADMRALAALPNVHFLPACPYEEAPDYLAGFDLCLLPRKLDAWVAHSNPLKFKEYLAAGREVVSTDIPALRPWGDCAWIAASRDEFIAACEAILDRGEGRIARLDMKRLEAESWENKAAEVGRVLLETLTAKGRRESLDRSESIQRQREIAGRRGPG